MYWNKPVICKWLDSVLTQHISLNTYPRDLITHFTLRILVHNFSIILVEMSGIEPETFHKQSECWDRKWDCFFMGITPPWIDGCIHIWLPLEHIVLDYGI